MTNLTDEGLRLLARSIALKSDECISIEPLRIAILSALQQVRDAAKKEERERCAKVAEDMDTNERDNPRSAKSHADNIATAIRQME